MTNLIIVGCGRVGSELAYRLHQRGNKVSIIDHTSSAFNNLPVDFRGKTVEGEALNRDVLERAGINNAAGLACVTNSDTLNAVVGHIARSIYGISNVVVRNYDPRWRRLHEAFGHHMVSSTHWGAQRIEEMLYHAELRTVFSAGNGEIEIYEFAIPDFLDGKPMSELIPGQNCAPVSLTRAGLAMLPDRETTLKTGDIVLVSANLEGIQYVRSRLAAVKA
jgi:trk system potassium uptake protein TrkA